MLFSMNLDSELKNRLKECGALFSPQKNLSDTIRYLLDDGERELKRSLFSYSCAAEDEMRTIAQRYDQGEPLNIQEMQSLFRSFYAVQLYREEYFPHRDILITSIKILLALIESWQLTEKADIFFKREHFLNFLTDRKSSSENLLSSQHFQSIAEELKKILDHSLNKPIVKEEGKGALYSSIFMVIAKFLTMAVQEEHGLISNFISFERVIRPYLKDVIKVAKFYQGRNEKQSVTHYFTGNIYKIQNNIQDEPLKETPTINCKVSYGYRNLSFGARLNFKQKNIIIEIPWQHFNELLRFSSYLSAEDLPLDFIFKGQKILVMFFKEAIDHTIGYIQIHSSTIYMTAEEFKDLLTILSQLQPSNNRSIDLIQYQLGSL